MPFITSSLRVWALCLMPTVAGLAAPNPVTQQAARHKPVVRKAAPQKATRSLAPVRPMVAVPCSATPVDVPITLRGGVKGRNGLPLAGATIWVSGTTQQVTVTNSAGNFNITLPDASPVGLSCGYEGYKQQALFLQTPGQQQDVVFTLQATTGRRKH
ncbi:carboxypeptidase regulatory-like domain-containing protein [Hymenobacter fodinae]|uniref:Carboxypeptidase-like regulatory domain-containing protein n=1 Tax=Hymenobacter fodinae TaxID=2510796 RepID=A0A4Z0P5P3_9BACT|nr:carboxypeptidase-like regulatory domain-containing protein [Hymenobacter fodinae]TGE06569.1 hypothetical protein EU556_17200 [Hymenobacter fodinae]